MGSANSTTDSRPAARSTWTAAILSTLLCGLLFEVGYNFCNWYTTQRDDVGMWYFAWETRIPFVPAMIVPYWTLNLFFVSSFFVCATLMELRILRRRIALAILVACACFLLFPLKLMFPRPEVHGFFGMLFAALRSFDQPHNLAPSLHIALRTLVWPIFIPRVSGLLNLLLRFWFFLIGASTLLVYQHQVMDVVTGWVLAICCLHLIAEPNPEVDHALRTRNARVGLYYMLGGIVLTLLTVAFWPWGALLIWPASALGCVALGYWLFGAVVFRKLGGRLALSTKLLLSPVLVGHFLSWHYYKRQCRPWDQVDSRVWIGRQLSAIEARAALAAGVTAVLDLTAEFSESAPFLESRYLGIPVLDLTAPTQRQLRRAVEFIAAESQRGVVYVHCKIGYSRSAAAVGAYLLHTGQAASVAEAIAQLRKVRPSIVVRPEAREALAQFWENRTPNSGGAQSPVEAATTA